MSDTQISNLTSRTTLENRVQMKAVETLGASYTDTTSIDKSETEAFRSQINEADTIGDTTQTRSGAQELRPDQIEKDSDGAHRTAAIKKKVRKQEECLERLFSSPDCLDEAAITLNFLSRRLLCDLFDEPLFKDLLKEKIELKLKEMAVRNYWKKRKKHYSLFQVSVLDDLRVETIDMGNTFPVILKIESMQWNAKGLWFNLFIFYRGSFK